MALLRFLLLLAALPPLVVVGACVNLVPHPIVNGDFEQPEALPKGWGLLDSSELGDNRRVGVSGASSFLAPQSGANFLNGGRSTSFFQRLDANIATPGKTCTFTARVARASSSFALARIFVTAGLPSTSAPPASPALFQVTQTGQWFVLTTTVTIDSLSPYYLVLESNRPGNNTAFAAWDNVNGICCDVNVNATTAATVTTSTMKTTTATTTTTTTTTTITTTTTTTRPTSIVYSAAFAQGLCRSLVHKHGSRAHILVCN
jgi:hypothetical protein